MPLTVEQIEAIEDQNDIAAIIQEEEEMEMQKAFVPWMAQDGEETDAREE